MANRNKVPLKIDYFGQTHCTAECRDCDWRDEDHVHAGLNASSHAKLTRHRVRVEKGMAYEVRPIDL